MKTTVIIPCFNSASVLDVAIESVLAQTRPVDEIIIVDDCSTDESREIATRYPVRLLTTTQNSGHATARNIGIDAAKGELIAWLDADDYWEPEHCEIVCGLLEKWPDAGVAFSGVRMFGSDTRVFGHKAPCRHTPRNVFWNCVRNTIVPAMSAVTRAAAIRAVGGFDGSIRYAPDFDLWLRMARRFPFVSTDRVTANYRRHEQQISARPQRQLESVYRSRFRCLETLEAEGDQNAISRMRELIREVWEKDLRAHWNRRDVHSVRFLLSLQGMIPGSTRRVRELRWKSRIPRPAIALWDEVRSWRR